MLPAMSVRVAHMFLYLSVEVFTDRLTQALTSPDPSTTSLHQIPPQQDSRHGVPRA